MIVSRKHNVLQQKHRHINRRLVYVPMNYTIKVFLCGNFPLFSLAKYVQLAANQKAYFNNFVNLCKSCKSVKNASF